MKLIYLLLVLAPLAQAQQKTPSQAVQNQGSALQAACIKKITPTLKRAERIRDIGSAKGKVEQDIMFAISQNGGKTRAIACQVQKNGTLKLVEKGNIPPKG